MRYVTSRGLCEQQHGGLPSARRAYERYACVDGGPNPEEDALVNFADSPEQAAWRPEVSA